MKQTISNRSANLQICQSPDLPRLQLLQLLPLLPLATFVTFCHFCNFCMFCTFCYFCNFCNFYAPRPRGHEATTPRGPGAMRPPRNLNVNTGSPPEMKIRRNYGCPGLRGGDRMNGRGFMTDLRSGGPYGWLGPHDRPVHGTVRMAGTS